MVLEIKFIFINIAISNNSFRIVEALLKAGAQLNINNNKLESATFKAIESKYFL